MMINYVPVFTLFIVEKALSTYAVVMGRMRPTAARVATNPGKESIREQSFASCSSIYCRLRDW